MVVIGGRLQLLAQTPRPINRIFNQFVEIHLEFDPAHLETKSSIVAIKPMPIDTNWQISADTNRFDTHTSSTHQDLW